MTRRVGMTAALAATMVVAVIGTVVAEEKGKGKEAAEVKGSIAVKGETGDALLGMAKVTLQAAVDAAVKKTPGAVWKAELEAEDGSLIYTIQVVTTAHEWKEVNVDAGTGAILAVEAGDKDEFAKPEGKDEQGKHEKKSGDKDGDDDDN